MLPYYLDLVENHDLEFSLHANVVCNNASFVCALDVDYCLRAFVHYLFRNRYLCNTIPLSISDAIFAEFILPAWISVEICDFNFLIFFPDNFHVIFT